MHERVHGVGFSSTYQLTENQWQFSYPQLIRNAGYYTGFIGKIGMEYYTFKDSVSKKFDFWRGHNGWTKFFPKMYNTPSCIPYHDSKEDIITYITGESIEMFLDSIPADKPFCLSVSFSEPHGSQAISMDPDCEDPLSMKRPANNNPRLKGDSIYDMLYRDIDFEIPKDCTSDPYQYLPEYILDQSKGRKQTYIFSYNKLANHEHHIRYYQLITGVDKIIGDLIKSLEKRGLAKNTVIVFASDNGLIMGEYGMGGKELLYDLASKIPCFIVDPSMPEHMKGKTLTNLVSSLDITATLLDYSNVKVPDLMDGKSLRPLVNGKNVEWRKELFLESLFALRGNPFCEGIRNGKWKYIRMYTGKNNYVEADLNFKNREPDFEQLFDLDNDPTEHINLIKDYEETPFLEELRIKCEKYFENINKKRENYMTKFDIKTKK